jgi:hypothetical protein
MATGWSPERRKRQSELARRLIAEGKLGGRQQRKRPDDVVGYVEIRDPADRRKRLRFPVTREVAERVERMSDEEREARRAEIVAKVQEREKQRQQERERRAADHLNRTYVEQSRVDMPGFGGFEPHELERVDPVVEAAPPTDLEVFFRERTPGEPRVGYFDADGSRRRTPSPDGTTLSSPDVGHGASPWCTRGAGL